jgi:hypothetical protein
MPEWAMVAGLVLIAVVGVGTLGGGICILAWVVRFRWVAARAVGVVVETHSQWQEVTRSNETGSWKQMMLIHYPVIAFEDANGERHEVRANIGNCTPVYQVDERVPILFIPGDPKSMRIDSFMSLY